MSEAAHGAEFEPFFLDAAQGQRFCIYHPPLLKPRGGIVYVHPFGDEMNKTRRMAALQSRMFAANGYAVLQIDLLGCGDSSGEFVDARWESWRQDVALGVAWLSKRVDGGIALWGLRLGALLALDAARICDPPSQKYIFWQPIISGASFLTQFLRMRLASEMIAGGVAQMTTNDLRMQINAGTVLEIGGYELAPELALAIDGLKLIDLAPERAPIYWFDIVAGPERSLSPASRHVVEAWSLRGLPVQSHAVAGEPFWNTAEIAECAGLLSETTRAVIEARV